MSKGCRIEVKKNLGPSGDVSGKPDGRGRCAAQMADGQGKVGFAVSVTGHEVNLERGAAALIRAEEVELEGAGAVAIMASDKVEIEGGGAQWIIAGETVSVSRGGAAAMICGGDMTVNTGGGSMLVAGGNMTLNNAGGAALVAGKATLHGGYVGICIAAKTSLAEGARVLLTTRQAAAFGAALGLTLALLGWRRKKPRQNRS